VFRGILLVCMAEEEKKEKAAKKKVAKKKSASPAKPKAKDESKILSKQELVKPPSETPSLPPNKLPKIYNDSKYTKHPSYPTEDLIKVLVRSPKEAFVFWKFSENTLERMTKELEVQTTDVLKFRLKVEYQNVFGSDRVEWYDLHPFTESYYLKFMFPVKMIQCTIFVSYLEKEIPSLHSTGKDLPLGTESFRLDKEWIHPEWIRAGLVTQSPSGEFYFRETNASGYYVNPRNKQTNEDSLPNENFPFANGSGSGKGIL